MKKEMHLVYRIDQEDDIKELEKIEQSEDAFKILKNIRNYIEKNEDHVAIILFKDWFVDQLECHNIDL